MKTTMNKTNINGIEFSELENFINERQRVFRIMDGIDDVMHNFHISSPCDTFVEMICFSADSVIEHALNDQDNHWLTYFMYDLNFGKDWEPGKVKDSEGNDIPLATIEDLWNVLCENNINK